MANVYCGIGDIPKKSRRGSMKECAQTNQIRYFGLHKVDTRTIEGVKKQKSDARKITTQKVNILKRFTGIKGLIKKLEGDVKYMKKEEDKKEAKKKLNIAIKEKASIEKEWREFAKKHGFKGGSRRSTKKTTKRNSKKPSKRSSRK